MNKTQLQFASRKPSANRGSLGRRLSALAMSLLLVCSLPLAAFADTWYLEDGDITVNATESGQTVSQGETSKNDDAPVITQSNSSTPTTNTITITATENATANVTIQDVNIVISDPAGAPQDHSGQAAVTIDVADGAAANVNLDGVNIDVGGTGGYDYYQDKYFSGEAAVQITGNGDVTMELDGENTVQGGYMHAGVEKNSGGKLTITDETGTDGSLEATGGDLGSGIGGGLEGDASNITIAGSAEVNAQGGDGGAGIGGGNGGSGSDITIEGSAEVIATGGNSASGIGGGFYSSGSNITITGSAEVTAKSDIGGSGIGGGRQSTGSGNITVSGDAQVKAQGGKESVQSGSYYYGAGAAIGEGGKHMQGAEADPGDDVTPNTDALNEGWVATYAPDTENMNTATPNSLTYKDASGKVQTATENITIEAAESATSNTHGHEAGFKVDNTELVAVTTHNYGNYQSDDNATCTHEGTESAKCTVPGCTAKLEKTIPGTMKDHEFVNYVPDANNLATCTTDGTKTATCENCTATDTVTDPAKGHSFTNYISDNNATYDHDGTKTAKCDHCDATHTIPDPGTRLPAPLYQLKGQDGMAVGGKTEQKDGVLTITVDADYASLTGYLGGLQGLRAQGVETIVFVTNGATSTFALADLMASMTAGDSYALTHDGETVTFTLATGTDISSILK